MLSKNSTMETLNRNKMRLLIASIILLKISLDYKYYSWLSILETNVYTRDFNLIKYINGILWLVILFNAINHTRRSVSTFLITIVYVMQIIPITTIYALGNKEALCYNGICFSFYLTIFVVNKIDFSAENNMFLDICIHSER